MTVHANLQLSPPLHRFQHRDLISIFDVTTGGDAGGDAGYFESGAAELAGKIGGRGFAFDGGIGGEDDLVGLAVLDALHQIRNAQLLRAHAVDGRDGSVQHVIDAVVRARLLDGSDVRGFFHDANQALVAGCAGTIGTRVNISDIATYRTKVKCFFKSVDRR